MPRNGKSLYPPLPSSYTYDPSIITKSISAAISILDKDFRIVWMNEIQQKWFGPLSKLKGEHCFEIYERRKKICPGCPVIKVFKYGLNECVSLRKNIIVAGNQKRHFKLTAAPIKDKEGNVVQVLELVEDVTEQVEIERKVKRKLNLVSRELDFISRLDKQFVCSSEVSLDQVLKQVIEIVPALFGSNICNLRMINGDKKILITRASKGLSKGYIHKTVMQVGEGVAGKVAVTKKPIMIKDILAQQSIKFIEDLKKEGIRSIICVPIISKKETLGTLTVYDKKIGGFAKNDSKLLMNFSNHVAILVDNINIRKKVFISYMNTIKSLVSAVEARDTYTRGHSEKVTKYALDISKAIGLPKADRTILAYCGKLHDIGKIAVSDVILNKRGPLTPAERAEIQMHPMKGVEILSNLNFLKEGIPAVKHHHERYDGKGYPDGLKGKDIPLSARIIGCADSFDAMTSDRAYRRRRSMNKAIEELRANRKKQFDPDIADVFIDMLKAKDKKA